MSSTERRPSGPRAAAAGLTVLLLGLGGCRSFEPPQWTSLPVWDVTAAEIVEWRADDPAYEQDFALEASGLAATGARLYVASEKYGRLLVIGGATVAPPAKVVRLGVPRHAELEGVAATPRTLLLCDEAHAAVYEVSRAAVDAVAEGRRRDRTVPTRELSLRGMVVRGGKIGFEGIEHDPVTGDVLLLLERSHSGDETCVSRLFRLRSQDSTLVLKGEPLEIELADCAWRITGLAWAGGTLLGLRTQYPGERYEVVAIDLRTGDATVVLELTELLRGLAAEGWGNNVEGLAIAPDGAMWLVADNAVTGVIDDPLPPPASRRTLLLRIPAAAAQ